MPPMIESRNGHPQPTPIELTVEAKNEIVAKAHSVNHHQDETAGEITVGNGSELVAIESAPVHVSTLKQSPAANAMTLEMARAKTAGLSGKKYWRSLDELHDTPGFNEMLQREFPSQASEWVDPVSRRGFLKLMSASLALAGLSGCTKQPDEAIYPYIKQPEDLILGKPVFFATAFPFPTGAVP